MRPEVEAEVLARFAAPRDASPAPPPGPLLVGADYADPRRAALERERVFSEAWVPVAREASLSSAGDCVTLTLADVPLVVVRDEGGSIRVLRNVCVHRGAVLVRTPTARVTSLRCPYHAFDYALDGALRSCPVPEALPEHARPGRAGLAPVRSARYAGWVWACLAAERPGAGAAPELSDALGDALRDELDEYPLHELTPIAAAEREVAFDWKVGVEAFLEPLHVPAIHARSAHTLVDYRGFATRALGEHSRMALPFRSTRAFEADGVLGSVAAAAGVSPFPRLNTAQRRAHFVYHVFPSLVWMLFPNHALTLRFLPAGPERCRVWYEVSASPPKDGAAAAWRDSLRAGYERLVAEDLENLPWIQRGLAAAGAGPPALSGYEARIAHFHAALSARLAP